MWNPHCLLVFYPHFSMGKFRPFRLHPMVSQVPPARRRSRKLRGRCREAKTIVFLFFVYHYIIYFYTLWYVHYIIYIYNHYNISWWFIYIIYIHTYIHMYIYYCIFQFIWLYKASRSDKSSRSDRQEMARDGKRKIDRNSLNHLHKL